MISESALEFYDKNKHIKSTIPKLPEGLVTDYEIADWLLNKSDFGWLELDIAFDLEQWKKEALIARSEFVPHRESDSHGWNSVCVHGIDTFCTGAWTKYGYGSEEEVPYKWTSLSDRTPSVTNFWRKFPYKNYRRIRFMEVEAGGSIDPHSDMPGRLPGEENFNALKFGVPINVAIYHPKDCFMTLQGHGCVPWQEGKAFIINIRNYHSVINLSNESRIHLIAHGKTEGKLSEFVELVARSYRKQYEQTY